MKADHIVNSFIKTGVLYESFRDVFDALMTKRPYHNKEHLGAMLRAAQATMLFRDCRVEIQLAVIFHDLVYNPKAKPGENERASVAMMERFVVPNLVGYSLDLVRRLILSTGDSSLITDDITRFFHDLDYGMFAVPYEQFISLDDKIVAEYAAAFSPRTVLAGRVKFLRHVLSSPVFLHPHFAHLNAVAESNVRRILTAKYNIKPATEDARGEA